LKKRIDAAISRKQFDLHELVRVKPPRVVKTLRLILYNVFDNQETHYQLDANIRNPVVDPPSWTLRMEGYLVEDEATNKFPVNPTQRTRRFSSFFKKIFILLDKNIYPDSYSIEWDKSRASGETDGFEIKRRGDQECNVKILLHVDFQPTRYKLSPTLSQLLNLHTDTKPKIILNLWQYIKMNKLQDPDDRKSIQCNAELRALFGRDKVQFSALPQLLTEHLGPPQPIELNYTIRLSGDPKNYEECYDIQIEVEEPPPQYQMQPATKKEIEVLDDQITHNIQKMISIKEKKDLLHEFTLSPVEYLNNLIASQTRDYMISKSSTGRSSEEDRHSSFYNQPLIHDAITHYLFTKNNTKS